MEDWKWGQIQISGQPWLLDSDNPYITTVSPVVENAMVSSLLCTDRKEWDVDLIKDVFNPRDQKSILSMKLDESSTEDVMYWSLETTGMYSVKSAYKLLQMKTGDWHLSDD